MHRIVACFDQRQGRMSIGERHALMNHAMASRIQRDFNVMGVGAHRVLPVPKNETATVAFAAAT
jgi:hypothetical protein